ncbi:MAG: hemoglobin [Myxococcota bacterium]|jgi:hemoglobin
MSDANEIAADTDREHFPVDRIEHMVHTFYGRVREDEVLGPIFASRITDWPHHLGRMVQFWRAVLRSEAAFSMSERGSPPVLHRQIDELARPHFKQWLGLFFTVVDETYHPDDAVEVKAAAQRIAGSLSRHLPAHAA